MHLMIEVSSNQLGNYFINCSAHVAHTLIRFKQSGTLVNTFAQNFRICGAVTLLRRFEIPLNSFLGDLKHEKGHKSRSLLKVVAFFVIRIGL